MKEGWKMKRLIHYIIALALIFCLTVTADAAQMLAAAKTLLEGDAPENLWDLLG